MGREIYDIIYDMAEVLNASQMQKLQALYLSQHYFKSLTFPPFALII